MKQLINIFIFCTSICLSVVSCISVKSYQEPATDTSDLFGQDVKEDTATVASIPWYAYFDDPYLNTLIDAGLNNNFDLRIALTRIEQSEANLSMARAAYFPTAALSATVQHNRFSEPGSGDVLRKHTNQFTLGIVSTWELDLWGKLSSQSRANYASLLASYSYRNLVQTTLIANIANYYYSLLALDEQLRITRETVKILRESSETMQAMMEAGMLNGAAVQQSLGLQYATEASIPDLESQIRHTENALNVLLGRKPGTVPRSTIQEQSVPNELRYGLPMQMLARRPDVQQAELNFRTAFEVTNVARASFYPSITLNSGSMVGYSHNTLSHFFRPENLVANMIGGLTQPIFARNQLRGNLKIAKAQQEEALLTFEKTVLSAGSEVSDILAAFEAALKKAESRTHQIEALETAVYFTGELLTAGEANYTEVLNAQQSLLQAQLNQVNDKLEQLQAAVNLYRALGGGIE